MYAQLIRYRTIRLCCDELANIQDSLLDKMYSLMHIEYNQTSRIQLGLIQRKYLWNDRAIIRRDNFRVFHRDVQCNSTINNVVTYEYIELIHLSLHMFAVTTFSFFFIIILCITRETYRFVFANYKILMTHFLSSLL